jgi:S-adenosylmethionine:tRNA ribosyltransferase-isomerase
MRVPSDLLKTNYLGMKKADQIKIADYSYHLPEDKIAYYPLAQRDQSKLLVYKDQQIIDQVFSNLPLYITNQHLLVFNNTRVIHARLLFTKQTGSVIEIMCLEPKNPIDPALAFRQTDSCTWLCLIGNNKKWKEGDLQLEININNKTTLLNAQKLAKQDDAFLVKFSWTEGFTFTDVIEHAGKLPLPPYLYREANETDEERYQTVYAVHNGSVAAPTAGLHFTPAVLKALQDGGTDFGFVTLHIGVGTFKPVKTETIGEHNMHEERIFVSMDFLQMLVQTNKKIVAVGTTSLRTLESLYWFGLNLHSNKTKLNDIHELYVDQWEPYLYDEVKKVNITVKEAIQAIIDWMQLKQLTILTGYTKIIISPPYKIKVADALITNFHMPESTLLLLVSAFTNNNWWQIYNHALKNNYRFLSYGDSSLLFR